MKEIVEKKGINCVKPVIAIVTKENAGFWAEKTNTMSKAELETYVRGYKANFSPGENKIESVNVEMELDPKVAELLKKMKGDRDWNTFMKELMDGQPKPEPVKTESPYIPVAIKKHVATKTNGICAHPDCNKPAIEFHHTTTPTTSPISARPITTSAISVSSPMKRSNLTSGACLLSPTRLTPNTRWIGSCRHIRQAETATRENSFCGD